MELNLLNQKDEHDDKAAYFRKEMIIPARYILFETQLSVPFLIRYIHKIKSHIVTSVLNFIMQLSVMAFMYMFSIGYGPQWMIGVIPIDISLSMIADRFHSKYPFYFGYDSLETVKRDVRTNVISYGVKSILMILLIVSIFQRGSLMIALANIVMCIYLVLTMQANRKANLATYDSIFHPVNLFSLCMFGFKYHLVIDFSWTLVFLIHLLIGWFLFLFCMIQLILMIIMMIVSVKLCVYGYLLDIMLTTLGIIPMFAISCLLITFTRFMETGSGWFGYSFSSIIVYTSISLAIPFLFFIRYALTQNPEKDFCYYKQAFLDTSFLNKMFDNLKDKIENEIPDQLKNNFILRQMLNDVDLFHVHVNKEMKCKICYIELTKTFGIIDSCMHAGICLICSNKLIQTTSACPMCRKPMEKISIIEKISDTEYKIVEEIKAV